MDDRTENQSSRRVMLAIGCIAALIALASTVCSWTAPFPLVSDGQGGFSLNPLEDRVLLAGLLSGLAASIFGGIWQREAPRGARSVRSLTGCL